ncbi:putative signal peptide-containing protein [Cryptosporidium canis]|uniref:Signal peptide-containing protein n=1 Tax=Cryptosporidium canis TaxID=195482 RepID=A0ABQ8P5G9_9CRYT|nr:putative signal peptide-containing protein [Cryptosporidium canis]KAJ1613459.1 putative signal peptide-containing protein [Cryptosporidium canis]
MSSLGFFQPLLRVIKSLYSIDENSSSDAKYNSLKHLEYEHLQHASNMEVAASIKGKRRNNPRTKIFYFPEEVEGIILNNTSKNKTLEAQIDKCLNSIQTLESEVHSNENLTLDISHSNNGTGCCNTSCVNACSLGGNCTTALS